MPLDFMLQIHPMTSLEKLLVMFLRLIGMKNNDISI